MAIACVLYQINHHIALLLPNKLSMEAEPTPDAPLTCSQSKCKRLVPSGPYKTCDPCRTKNTEARKAKRARDKEAEEARKRARTDDPAENRGGASRNEEDGPDGPESSDTEGDSPNVRPMECSFAAATKLMFPRHLHSSRMVNRYFCPFEKPSSKINTSTFVVHTKLQRIRSSRIRNASR